MKIPKKLKIAGHEYDIIFPYVYTERYDRAGDHDFSAKRIRIAEKECDVPMKESAIMVIFIHEVLHAIDGHTGHNMFVGEEGESRVEALSEGIYQVLIDNGFL